MFRWHLAPTPSAVPSKVHILDSSRATLLLHTHGHSSSAILDQLQDDDDDGGALAVNIVRVFYLFCFSRPNDWENGVQVGCPPSYCSHAAAAVQLLRYSVFKSMLQESDNL